MSIFGGAIGATPPWVYDSISQTDPGHRASAMQEAMMQAMMQQGYNSNAKPWSQSRLFEMIAMRMRWGSSTPPVPMTAIHVDDRVFITVVKDGKAQLIDEGDELFPSDTLITQLRLLF